MSAHSSHFLNPGSLGALWIDDEECEAVHNVLKSGELFRYGIPQENSENACFERELSEWSGAAATATFSSGTAALKCALVSLGVKPGDKVLVSAYTFIASAAAVCSLGAIPVPIDMDGQLGVDLDSLLRNIGAAKVVMLVYAPGHSSNIVEVQAIAAAHGVPVLEDASQALGVRSKGLTAGLIGDIGVYSFQQGKQITCGEGGAVLSSESRLAHFAAQYADHGAVRDERGLPDWHSADACIGENMRLSELQAALLRVQLRKLPTMLERQRSLHLAVREVADSSAVPYIRSHCPEGDSGSMLFFLVKSYQSAFDAISLARERGLLMRFGWKYPFCDLPVFARAQYSDQPLVLRARELSGRLLGLPIPPLRDVNQRSRILEGLRSLFTLHGDLWR